MTTVDPPARKTTATGLALEGCRVLDFTQYLSGPYCTKVLADMGAEVIKVERIPSGDDARGLDPKVNGESYPFAVANANKKSIAVDLKSREGLEIVLRLARDVDVVIENFRPGVMQRLGVGYETTRDCNPKLIYCSITGFGQTGLYSKRPGFDIIAQGMSGLMKMSGQPGETRPQKMGIAINDLAAGATALHSILYALIRRTQTGEGQYIDVSLVDAALAWTIWEAAAFFGGGELPLPSGTRHRRSAPYQAYKTSDGYVTVGANNDRLWRTFCEKVVERPEWIVDTRYFDLSARMNHVDELEQDIESVLTERPTEYWIDSLDRAGVPGGPVLAYDEVLSHPLTEEREMLIELDHPVIGQMKVLGMPSKLTESPLQIQRPAPSLGEHTEEVLVDAGISREYVNRLAEKGVILKGTQGS